MACGALEGLRQVQVLGGWLRLFQAGGEVVLLGVGRAKLCLGVA